MLLFSSSFFVVIKKTSSFQKKFIIIEKNLNFVLAKYLILYFLVKNFKGKQLRRSKDLFYSTDINSAILLKTRSFENDFELNRNINSDQVFVAVLIFFNSQKVLFGLVFIWYV